MRTWLHINRFELLLIALLLVIFNRIFFFQPHFYSALIWPINMMILGVVSMGVFHETSFRLRTVKNILFAGVVTVPFFAGYIFQHDVAVLPALLCYISFYAIIFADVMRQITRRSEITRSIIYGSLSGFLLIIILCTFTFLVEDYFDPDAFHNLSGQSIPEKYHQVVYFSCVTLTTIGFGDIVPASDNARLLTAFWGVVGQFYMVAVVGIIVSKFTSVK